MRTLQVKLAKWWFRASPNARARLWNRLASLTEAKITIRDALMHLSASAVNHGIASTAFVRHQADGINRQPFASAAAGWIPQEEAVMIRLRQEENISAGFRQAERVAGVRATLRSTLIARLTYPIVVFLMASVIISILPRYAMQALTSLSDPSTWPLISRSLLTTSEFIYGYGLLIMAAIIAVFAVLIWAAPRWHGPLRGWLDWNPVFRIYRQVTAPEVLSAWITLVGSGTTNERALQELRDGLPPYLASHVSKMINRLHDGVSIEQAMDTGLFSNETLDDIRIFRVIGRFMENAERIATTEVTRALKRLESSLKILTGVILAVIGVMAVWMYLGMARVTLQQQSILF